MGIADRRGVDVEDLDRRVEWWHATVAERRRDLESFLVLANSVIWAGARANEFRGVLEIVAHHDLVRIEAAILDAAELLAEQGRQQRAASAAP